MSSKARILVVDDDRSLVQVIERLLEKAGFEVLTAFNGLKGLQKARGEKPDLIIMDIIVPKMDGYETYRRLKSNLDTVAIPVLMLTHTGSLADSESQAVLRRLRHFYNRVQERLGSNAGAIDFLSKPVTARELLDRMEDLLWRSGSRT